ncbi:MAG: indolepyruvate oxidoreductase subunit beta [Syntrophobacterales bacterium]|nr:indolepyruvate oxidoreductase subunit beta [Syntrophobacterales bacterium]
MKNDSVRLRIFMTGVGGQGTLLASRVLGEAALAAGFTPLLSETHGMAQRGGVVTSTVILGDLKSPIISPGEADLVLAFEALEALRALEYCHARTLMLANTAVIPPYPVAVGQVSYPEVSAMLAVVARQVGGLLAFDAGALAREAGSPLAVNMVLLGALAATDTLPVSAADLQQVIRDKTNPRFVNANLSAFEMGAAAAREPAHWLRRPAA